jgi:hypothetical protein
MTAEAEHNTGYKLTFGRVVRSEWTKLFSQRSTWIVLGGVPLLLIGLSAAIGWNNRGRPTAPTVAIGGGFLLYALVIGVFGLLTMTGEYHSGLIRPTLLTVPRRLPVLWAKALVLVATTVPIMIVAYFGSFLAHQAFASSAIRISLSDPHVLRSIFGAAGATVAAGLMGLAIGTMLRSTASAITVYVAGLVILPQVLLGALPASLQDTVLPYLPTLALQAMFEVGDGSSPMLNPGAGGIVVLGWVILMLGGAAAVLQSRDA